MRRESPGLEPLSRVGVLKGNPGLHRYPVIPLLQTQSTKTQLTANGCTFQVNFKWYIFKDDSISLLYLCLGNLDSYNTSNQVLSREIVSYYTLFPICFIWITLKHFI